MTSSGTLPLAELQGKSAPKSTERKRHFVPAVFSCIFRVFFATHVLWLHDKGRERRNPYFLLCAVRVFSCHVQDTRPKGSRTGSKTLGVCELTGLLPGCCRNSRYFPFFMGRFGMSFLNRISWRESVLFLRPQILFACCYVWCFCLLCVRYYSNHNLCR